MTTAAFTQNVVSIDVVDDLTLNIVLTGPWPSFAHVLAGPTTGAAK